ncbi:MAG TPA: phasin family protein [Acetobacteraceae bacterium]|jgi:phasin family protein|nr:phasin family protein [Acetobacteraceae bacterium]
MASKPENRPGAAAPDSGPDFSGLLARMQLPGMPDMDAVLAAHRKNIETLTAANRVAIEGAQAVARRNMEIMQKTMSELTENLRSFASPEPPPARAAKQAEMLKLAYENAVANMREVGDLIQKSNAEALGLINRRFVEAMDEVKALVAKQGQ